MDVDNCLEWDFPFFDDLVKEFRQTLHGKLTLTVL